MKAGEVVVHWETLAKALFASVGALCFLVWLSIFFVNTDPLWFLPSFTARADEIRIYWDGEQYSLFPGDPGYDEVMDAFGTAVGQWKAYDPQVALSAETLNRMRTEWRMVEVRYDKPVQVHSYHSFPSARFFYVPFSGAHFRERRLFASLGEAPKRAGALNLQEELYTGLEEAVTKAVTDIQTP